ncbi:MAG: hypothetical protein AMS21_01125 [Gemmatimonas sp. SG8_38_2]|nr:MAG: hypothetical protein AMS21_01125 [Gemmatimonas sp. SG8_38_2]
MAQDHDHVDTSALEDADRDDKLDDNHYYNFLRSFLQWLNTTKFRLPMDDFTQQEVIKLFMLKTQQR